MELLYSPELVKTNDPPPVEIVQRIRAHLRTTRPIKENALKETEEEWDLLEQRFAELHNKLEEHKESLSKYEAILSPARRIPIDILHHIFYHCLPPHRNPTMSAYEAPMVLAQVCSTWRAVAFSSPRLWSKLRINFAYRSRCDVDHRGNAIDGEKILHMRCVAVKEWLDRSGSCPVSISIHHNGMEDHNLYTGNFDEDSVVNTLELFKIIVGFSPRWEEIELVMSREVYSRLEPMIPIEKLSSLKIVRIQLKSVYGLSNQLDGPGSILLKAPNIREVSLVGDRTRLWTPTMAPWTHLTNFSSRAPSSLHDCFALVSRCQNLVRCTIRLFSVDFSVDTLQFKGTAFLPHLQTLCIIAHPSQRQATTKLLDQFNAPKLIHISYEVPENYYNSFVEDNTPFPFLLLLEVATIRSLTIDPRHLSSDIDEMPTILRLSKGITHLFIGHRTANHSGLDDHPSHRFDYLGLFQLLTIDVEATSPDEVMLPNLQVFSATVNYSVSKDTIVRFIDSRSDPSSPFGTAILKSVNIAFPERPRNSYISEESLILGDKFGVQVKTYYRYIDSHYSHHRVPFYSPLYDLSDNDRSWPYEDIDESIIFLD